MLSRTLISLLSVVALSASAESLFLTGEIAARNSQVFVAPQADNWMVQIDWMVEEGERVEPGEPVVQYATASIVATLEQLEANLRRVEAESRRSDLVQDLALREAQHNHRVASLNLEKARLDAGIPRELSSELQYEQYQLALTRAQNLYTESEKALAIKAQDVIAEKQRSQVEIAGAENELKRIQYMLDNMTQHADRSGTAMYVDHPWTRQKVREGDSVQRGFNVLEIPATDDLHVKAWLNEVDIARLHTGQNVRISFDARPELQLSGVVMRVGNQAEPKEHWGESGYMDVEIDIDGAQEIGLLPGMSVVVEIQEES
ncbi:MAG TPA: HlyD family efflux transporter periplasmic adaptor subunit [Cellvibrionaceae bacterium]